MLGVIIHETLTWNGHINTIYNKVYRSLDVIRKASVNLPKSLMFTLYYSLIQPNYDYCNILWASSSSVLLHKVLVTQRKAIRTVCEWKWNANINFIIKEYNLLNLKELNFLQSRCYMYKAVHNLIPEQLTSNFTWISDIPSYITRQRNTLHVIYLW